MKSRTELIEKFEATGHLSEDLDDIVYDLAAKVAEKVNKQGTEEQVKFLQKNGLSVKKIWEYVSK
jgi:hypothetical protein